MKKFTSFLLLSLAFMGTAGAQNAGTGTAVGVPAELKLTTSHDAPTYYYIKSRRTNQNTAIYLRYNGDNAGITRQAAADNTGYSTLWYFMASGDGVKIYSALNDQQAMAEQNSFTATGRTWYLMKNTHYTGTDVTYYVIDRDTNIGGGAQALDANNSNNGVGGWSCTAKDQEGTSWIFEEAPKLDFTTSVNSVKANIDKTTQDPLLVGTVKDAQALETLLDGATNITTIKAYQKFLTDVSNCLVGIEPNAYYEIENANGIFKKYPSTQNMHFDANGGFPYANNEDRVVRRVTKDSLLVPRLWKFELQGNGLYKIRNANTGRCWSEYVEAGVDMPVRTDGGGSYTLETIYTGKGNNKKFLIKIAGHMMNAYGGNADNVIRDYSGNHTNDLGSFWYIRKVTQIPVTIGVTKVATICLPFAVTLPEGLQAYKAVSSDGMKVTLTEMKGVIPANTGMLLSANVEGTYNLTITTEATTADTNGNKFQGATVRREGFTADATYAMAASKTTPNKAVLRLNGMTVIPANKAYMLSTDVPTAGAQQAAYLNFSFDNTTTGVESVETTTKEATKYYDLNGRLVLYPTKGIYVTSEGKKVYFQ